MTILAAVVLLAPVTACATASDIRKLDANDLWTQGNERLASRKWVDAARIFERFTLEFPTDSRYQEARYNLAQSRFGAKEYITAATEFSRLSSDYPAGPFADDAQYKVCESYQRLSPAIELDQQYTQSAIDQCQVLLSYFPASEFVPKATAIVAELTDKLAHKLYWTGDYYIRRKAHDSAIMYYELVVKNYPTSQYAPRALDRMIDTYKLLGYEAEEIATRARLLKDYPQSAASPQKPDSVGRR